MTILVSGLTIEENLKNFLVSINGKHVMYEGSEYIAMDVNLERGSVSLYSEIDCDQVEKHGQLDSVAII